MPSREPEQIGYIMRFVMNPDMVYQYPIWAVGLLLVGAAVFGAVLLELCARRLLPIELRQRHNDVAAAIFSIIGVTYAVLLAFVAMLAWEGSGSHIIDSLASLFPQLEPSRRSRLCRTVVRSTEYPLGVTSSTLRATTSDPRSLLSRAFS